MIKGINKNNQESAYREVQLDSSSSLKDFSLDRKKYFRKYICGETVEEKDSQASVTGRVVETLLLEPEKFDEKFYLSACAFPPTGLMLSFVEELYRINQENTTKSFEEMSKEAYIASGFKITYEAVIKKFIGSDAEIYYNEIVQVRANSFTVITIQDVTNAERIVDELRNNFVTKNILELVNSSRWTIKKQFQVKEYKIDDHLFKSMIDLVIIDHQEKTIQVYDLKCVWNVEGFYEDYFLYRRAYIQGYLYHLAIYSLTTIPNGEYNGYQTLPPQFIVCDSINYFNPLIYKMTYGDLIDAYKGFEHKGKLYPGVQEIITNLKFAIENNLWNISRENYLNNGIVKIK